MCLLKKKNFVYVMNYSEPIKEAKEEKEVKPEEDKAQDDVKQEAVSNGGADNKKHEADDDKGK